MIPNLFQDKGLVLDGNATIKY